MEEQEDINFMKEAKNLNIIVNIVDRGILQFQIWQVIHVQETPMVNDGIRQHFRITNKFKA